MRFVLLAIIAMGRAVMADNEASPAPSKLATGAACKKDGSMGVCTSNFCLQMPTDDTGVCQ